MQDTRAQPLIQEDPTRHRATKPVPTTTEPMLYSPEAMITEPKVLQLLTPAHHRADAL